MASRAWVLPLHSLLAAEAHRADGNHDIDPEYLQRNGLLGGGGYASVWLTTDTRTGRQRQ